MQALISQSSLSLPTTQQWSIIYKQRSQQMQKAESLEKAQAQQKKESWRMQLDNQVASKRNSSNEQKQLDSKYYHYISSKAQEAREMQQRDKFHKYLRLKQMEEHNKRNSEMGRLSRINNKQEGGCLQVGQQLEGEKKRRASQTKREVASILDQQIQQKQYEKVRQRRQEMELVKKNEAYLAQQFHDRSNKKQYHQNEAAYHYFQQLHAEKALQDRQLQHKLVDQASYLKEAMEAKKSQDSLLQRERRKIQMRDTLQRQVQLTNHRRRQERLANPEQNDYSLFGSMFAQKRKVQDKKQYHQFLAKQAEEQRLKRLQEKHMSPEEYKLHSNQLHKAVTGQYTQEHYQDRSIASLGNRPNIPTDPLQGLDAQIVKSNLESLRTKRRRIGSSRNGSDFTTL